jgi:hypothetical protein
MKTLISKNNCLSIVGITTIVFICLNIMSSYLLAQDSQNALSKKGGIGFRTDDNQPISNYLEYAAIFNRYNQKFSFALNLGRVEITSDYINGIRQMQSNGHEMMDHTPWHTTSFFWTKLPTDYYSNHPGVQSISGNKIELKFANVNISSAKRNGYVDINGDIITSASGIFSSIPKEDCYFYFPSLGKLIFIDESLGWIDANTVKATDVWRNAVNLGSHQNIQFYNFDRFNVHLTIDGLRALVEESVRVANYYGLQRPYSWVQPGSYSPQVYRSEIKQAAGDGVGYKSAGVFSDPSLKVFNEYNPSNDKQFGMSFGDFRDDVWTLEQCKEVIADRVAKHWVVFGQNHFLGYQGLLGGWSGFLDRTEKLIQWCVVNNIPIRTYSEWADVLYNQSPDPNENIFPPLNVDLDANNVPDGYNQFSVLKKTDGYPTANDFCYSINSAGQLCYIKELAGIEKGLNEFEIWTKGAPGDFIEVTFKVGTQNLVYKFPAENSGWTKYNLAQSVNGNTTLNIPNSISLIDVTIRCSNHSSGEVKISGMKLSKSLGNGDYLSVTPSSQFVSYAAGNTSFSILSNVSWSVYDDASWLTVNPSNGSNNATLTATYSENSSSNQRTGTITISGNGMTRTVTVIQDGHSSALTVSPSDRIVSNSAGSTTFSISSNSSWTVSDDASWLTVSPASGSNNGTITANFTENSSTSQRVGTITINGGGLTKTVTVSQASASLSLTVSPSVRQVSFTSGSTTFSISSNTTWTVSDNASWLTVSPASGSNNGTINANFTENSSTSQRVGTITINGGGLTRTVTVSQSAAPFSLTVSPSDRPVSYTSGSTTFSISSNTNWTVEDDVDWCTISPTSGVNNGTITATYTASSLPYWRAAVITVSGGGISRRVTVTQNAAPFLKVTPSDRYLGFNASSTTFTLKSNIVWTVEDDSEWLTVKPTSGTNDGTLTVTLTQNINSVERTGTISITGEGITKTVKVSQASMPMLEITPLEQYVGHGENSTTFAITSNRVWVLDDDSDWLTVTPTNGVNDGTITVTVAENPNTVERVGTISITGELETKTVKVIQASTPMLVVTPLEQYVGNEEDSTTFAITSNRGWTIEDDSGWLTVTPMNGANDGTIIVTIAENPNTVERVGTISITGELETKTVKVIQASMPMLVVTPLEQCVGNGEGSTTFTITSNRGWAVDDDSDWLTVTPTNGVNDGIITVTISENPNTLARTGTISITSEGALKTVTVKQAAKKFFTVLPTHFEFSADAGSAHLIINSNIDWVLNEDIEWLYLNKYSGSNSDTLVINYESNRKIIFRDGTISVYGDEFSANVNVVQNKGDVRLIISLTRKIVNSDSGKLTLSVQSNAFWKIQNNYDWIAVLPDSGEGDGNIDISYKANVDSLSRAGKLFFSSDTTTVQFELNQSGLDVFDIITSADSLIFGTTLGSGRYLFGSKARVSAIPNREFIFISWNENNTIVSTDSIYEFLVSSSRSLVAKFAKITGIDDDDELTNNFDLDQNYPNPFNPVTKIRYTIPANLTEQSIRVTLKVFDVIGNEIQTLVDDEQNPGHYEVDWHVEGIPSGIYLYQLKASDFISTKKMVVLK